MVRCVNGDCRKEIDDLWSFCPFCGADNRPPERRMRVVQCPHSFPVAKGFCTDCGARLRSKRRNQGRDPGMLSYASNDDPSWLGGIFEVLSWAWLFGCLGCIWIIPTAAVAFFFLGRWLIGIA